MAKSRAQRKAEQRRKRAQQQEQGDSPADARDAEVEAQHETQVPESAEVTQAEQAIEQGAPAPSRADVGKPGDEEQVSRRERRRREKELERKARESAERRAPKGPVVEKERGRVAAFFASVIAELRRVQWPNRDTLVQASAVTLLFVAVAAAYLGVLDAIFSRVVDAII